MGAMRHENALLFHGLYRHKRHRRAMDRFANCFGV
jgi:hypothetical protein